jgi:CO/xanthine dehydrogenase Mo-binding subunit
MDGPAPAIVNAIEDALHVPFNSIPLLPEDIFAALSENESPETVATTARDQE